MLSHIPVPGLLKSGIPEGVLIPAPVKATVSLEFLIILKI